MADLIDKQAVLNSNFECVTMTTTDGTEVYLKAEDVANHINSFPTVDAVPKDVLEQIRWERDIAIEQLNSYGVSFGEKADCAKVVRCKDCKSKRDMIGNSYCYCIIHNTKVYSDDFCSYGERREDDG